jgi:Fic family protein
MAKAPVTRRAGGYVRQLTGYSAFVPAPLPPDPPVNMRNLTKLLSDADRALGRLDGVATVLPNPNLFVAMYVYQEAVLSSQIEGTQSTLEDILEFEVGTGRESEPKDVEEVVNYVAAMNDGLSRLEGGFPLSLRLIRDIHMRLLTNVRGGNRTPGEFRTTQNWIGSANCSLADADFVPPAPHDMLLALDNFEKFLHERDNLPVLVQCGIAHAQFETIHPFLDGNGRIGRLLVTLLLCERGVLAKPLLYLSYYLKANRAQYYDRLTAIRNGGDWEGWLKFFLTGVYEVSRAATDTAREILALRERHRELVQSSPGNTSALVLLDRLFQQPIITVRRAEKQLGSSYVTASKVVQQLEGLGILRETTGQRRNRVYRYDAYMKLFERRVTSESEPDPPSQTESDH